MPFQLYMDVILNLNVIHADILFAVVYFHKVNKSLRLLQFKFPFKYFAVENLSIKLIVFYQVPVALVNNKFFLIN